MLVLLAFISFYVPCVSTFAVMLKTIGRREALFSLALSVAVALAISGVLRLPLALIEALV
jgi:ferrous iron transport protein B